MAFELVSQFFKFYIQRFLTYDVYYFEELISCLDLEVKKWQTEI